jgi:hypothetical protein
MAMTFRIQFSRLSLLSIAAFISIAACDSADDLSHDTDGAAVGVFNGKKLNVFISPFD